MASRSWPGSRSCVRTPRWHEPPLATVLPDREESLAATDDIHETYNRHAPRPAMAKAPCVHEPKGTDSPRFPITLRTRRGLRAADRRRRQPDHPLLGPHMIYASHYEPDWTRCAEPRRLRSVVAAGARVEGHISLPRAFAVAERTRDRGDDLPKPHGDHPAGHPGALAATLRRILIEHRLTRPLPIIRNVAAARPRPKSWQTMTEVGDRLGQSAAARAPHRSGRAPSLVEQVTMRR